MRNRFVKTSNVDRFLAGIDAVEDRGAPEAGIALVGGDAGFGKSRTGGWWAIQNRAVYLRVKAACTAHWVLKDLVIELGEQAPAYTCEKLFAQAVGVLVHEPRPIVVDEVEHTLKNDIRALEILRDVSDTCEVPLVLIGREFVRGRLKRERQIYTRISAYVEFGPATEADVALCVEELCTVPVAAEIVEAIHQASKGYIREIVKAIATVERVGRKAKGKPVNLELMNGATLCQSPSHATKSRRAA